MNLCRRPQRNRGTWLTLLLAMFCSVAQGQESVRIAMRPDAIVNSNVVKLSDLATIEGGHPEKRKAISQLDLEIGNSRDTSTISRGEMTTRLLVAGFDADEFRLTGPETTLLRPSANATSNTAVKMAITRHVSRGLNIDERDVQVDLLSIPDSISNIDDGQWQFSPLDHADRIIGRRNVSIGVFRQGKMQSQFQVLATTTVTRQVLVASRPIERGEVLNADNAFLAQKHFDKHSGQWMGNDGLGKTTARRIRAQQAIRPGDLVIQSSSARKEKVVRARDIVSVVAARGGLKITMSGMEAMKSGGVGDVIPLRNPDSKKIVYGKIVSASRIELSF